VLFLSHRYLGAIIRRRAKRGKLACPKRPRPVRMAIRHCGSWAAALTMAGMKPPERAQRGPNRDEIIAILRAYQREYGSPPSVTEWRRRRVKPGVKTIYRRFGSWPAALAAAGLHSAVPDDS
jgi:hypothetical protein